VCGVDHENGRGEPADADCYNAAGKLHSDCRPAEGNASCHPDIGPSAFHSWSAPGNYYSAAIDRSSQDLSYS
jgi:hypothetical protein